LFLDEIGELSLELQPKLLRVLQHGEIQRVGSDRVHRVDVRVIAATNRDIEGAMRAGRFRADLYHRLAAFPVHVPTLKERREDIPLLATHFAEGAARRLGLAAVRFTDQARVQLQMGDWPGNVRELENVVARGVLRASFGRGSRDTVVIDTADLDVRTPIDSRQPPLQDGGVDRDRDGAPWPRSRPLQRVIDSYEREVILAAVARNEGNWAAAARDLGLHRSNLHRRAQRIGLKQH
ncbi:MAG: sigma-54-dependent Fis family transcriptional regulator, partial [Luteitalea sp.]|nr:sigma-54-dependent Fis family transcriptional regulator [Luteitalea sp.]